MTANEIAREYFPDMDKDDLEHLIWGFTGFPYWWHIPKDGNTPEECFRKQLQEAKDLYPDGKLPDWPPEYALIDKMLEEEKNAKL